MKWPATIWWWVGIVATAWNWGASARDREPAGPSSRRTPFAITEIMCRPSPGTNGAELEFIEIHNSNPFFEELSGYRISGAVDYVFPEGTVLQGGEYRVIARNPTRIQTEHGISRVLGPWTGSLPQSGVLRLRNKEGAVLLEVPYANQPPWPAGADGTGHSLVLERPSHGEGRPGAWGVSSQPGGSPGAYDVESVGPERAVVINEFLANSVDPVVDYVELYNHSNVEVDLAGCALSDDPQTNKFILPAGTRISARGFLAFDQRALGFGLSAGGETIYFRNPLSRGGQLLDAIRFGAQGPNVARGRAPDGASEIHPLARPTPGVANGAIRVEPVVINEIMYKPISTLADDEYVELYNQGTNAVDLGGWRFTSGIDYEFPSGTVLAADGYLVVARNVGRLLTNYPNLTRANALGDFEGSLANKGDRIALGRPQMDLTTNSVGAVRTNTVYVVVDEVTYGVGGNWGTWANGGGSSLELIDPRSNHRLAHNWADSDESTKAPWSTIEFSGLFDLGFEVPNNLQVTLLGEGECLLDDVEIFAPGGANLCPNSTFESGLSGWTARGSHLRSTIEASGFQSAKSLHVRASTRGDTVINRLRIPLLSAAPTNAPGTIRARVRWLRGWPEILVRTHGGWGECFGRMIVPTNLGTPGARNSRAIVNAPPAVDDVRHEPVLPAAHQGVVVSARGSDPDGIEAMSLVYRIDPSPDWIDLPMRDDGTDGDAIAGDGIFSGMIAGQPAGTLVAFQIVASDGRGATQVFPLQDATYARPFECLVRFGEPEPDPAFGTYRIWMTQDNLADWQQRPSMSNERILGTFVYGQQRAVHNAGIKWSGSPFHQWTVLASPAVTEANYSLELPLDDQVLGTENFNKLHAPGNGPFEDASGQREQICYWTARQMGLPWGYRRYVNVFFNGYRRGGTNGLMEDAQTPGDDMIEQFFPEDADGNLYKMQLWFETGDAAAGAVPFTPVTGAQLTRYTTVSNGVSVPKIARVRNTYLTRSANGTANDYGPVFELIDAANTPAGPALTSRLSEVADIEEWFRIFAVEHATGNWDSFGAQSSQNMYGYRPRHGKYTLLIWDWNTVLGGLSGAWPPGQNLFTLNSSDSVMPVLYRHPPFRRMYLRALKEICTGPWAGAAMNQVLDAKYQALRAAGVGVAEPGVDGIKAYVATARAAILQTVAGEDATAFKVSSSNVITSSNNLVVITGEAPVETRSVTINGREYPIVWTDVRTFRIQYLATSPTNEMVIEGIDVRGQPIAGFRTNLTVVQTRVAPRPEAALVINEIMYHPTNPAAAYVEILNNSDFAFDLSGWRMNGVDYTFPAVTLITNQQHLVLAQDRTAFTAAYPGAPMFAEFKGALDPDGETLTLEKPVVNLSTNVSTISTNVVYQAVSKVRYEPGWPWPPLADGRGASLQLVDPTLDNRRPGAWTDREEWRRVVFTGVISGGANAGTNFVLSLSAAAETEVDDVVLVTGTTAEAGVNLLSNGDFEAPLAGTWVAGGNHSGSAVSTQFRHRGNASLRLVATGPGNATNAVGQRLPPFAANTVCTLSFWFRPNTNAANVVGRVTPGGGFSVVTALRPLSFTPGAPNTGIESSTPFASLWLNELQVENRTGVTDLLGVREPWLELYNAGSDVVPLDSYALVDHPTNGTGRWIFPPGTTIAGGAYALVWLDGQPGRTTTTDWHASFRPGSSGSIALTDQFQGHARVVDQINYADPGPDRSYGDFPDGQPFLRQRFLRPSPGAPNDPRDVVLSINEWMAANTVLIDPADGRLDDWFEIYNGGPAPVDLSGYWLTDNLDAPRQFEVPGPGRYVVPAGGFLLVWADNEPAQNAATNQDLHVNFQLRAAGEAIGLFAPNGVTAIDTVTFGPQTNGVSEGRFPDGAAAIRSLRASTPRARNLLGAGEPRATIGRAPDGRVLLTFDTVPGRLYRVEYKNLLNEATWTQLGPATAAPATSLVVVDDVRLQASRFYRVVALE